jgi:hypothetical protein
MRGSCALLGEACHQLLQINMRSALLLCCSLQRCFLQGVPLLQCYGANRALHVGTVVVALQVRPIGFAAQYAGQAAIEPSRMMHYSQLS